VEPVVEALPRLNVYQDIHKTHVISVEKDSVIESEDQWVIPFFSL